MAIITLMGIFPAILKSTKALSYFLKKCTGWFFSPLKIKYFMYMHILLSWYHNWEKNMGAWLFLLATSDDQPLMTEAQEVFQAVRREFARKPGGKY